MKIRYAKSSEMNSIYMMGYDAWSKGMTEESYLESCSQSPKYKNGEWWVLENDHRTLVSSLIVYKFGNSIFGIGSIATPVEMRGHCYATELIKKACTHLEYRLNAKAIYLFSDIKSEFYERHGFIKLPEKFQKHETSTCMYRSTLQPEELPHPDYF